MRVLTLKKIAARVANRRELLIPVLVLPLPWEESRLQNLKVATCRISIVDSIPAEVISRIKIFTRRFGPSDLTISI
jgi:hypothetical protein